ncbi:hypothetical protein CNR37_00034 [Pseudomonas phage ventosus]|uniref:Uncharacterized protein n=1 Tax=Pseudomonas phage ventosus TaxID=2048980 RepID=A0A2H4P7V7_9CAUD|nr:hypothetical protein CNR37_00034 [Pseudomonas phage ventosus]
MKTEIQRTSTLVNGEHIIKYRAKVTNFSLQYPILCYRAPALKMLEELNRDIYWMEQAEFDKLLGYLPKDSLERAQKIIDLLLEEVQKIEDKRERARQAKLTKQVTYSQYP